jgi:hypothetical protein
VTTDGTIEDVVVLPGPGDGESRVFYRIKRNINGVDVRYIERWALESEARGASMTKMGDAFATGTSSAVSGLTHLEGKTVVVWADGQYRGSFTVASGAISDTDTYTNWCAGLDYTAQYKSAKTAVQLASGETLTQRSRINKVGFVLADTYATGLQFGPDFSTMDTLPLEENEEAVVTTTTYTAYDEDMIEFPGDWDTDNRICLQGSAAKPCTVMAAVINIDRQVAS